DEIIMSTVPDIQNPVSNTFAVPADAYIGDKTVGMRVALKYDSTQIDPCGSYLYGEVEDYAVKIAARLSVNDNGKDNAVQVYPNPAIDVLNITKVSARATYTIYNMAGQAVSKGKVSDNKVQVSQLVKGVYIIMIDNVGEVSKVKFIKK
ncbi:MAG: T9SS type A sorting domain-containing protein, partial [Kaistella sp.]